MPRNPKAPQAQLPFDVTSTPTEIVQARTDGAAMSARKMGRPRKWESEAERKRAYRERLAADLAEPERLRRELRNAKRQATDKARRLAQAERHLARAEAEIARRSKRETDLERMVERLEVKVNDWRSRANALARNLETERSRVPSAPPARGAPPGPATRSARPKPPPKAPPRSRSKR